MRKIELDGKDPRLAQVAALQRRLIEEDDQFFYGWHIRREYTAHELASARLLTLLVTAVFEPAGEECETVYDESSACPFCGAGASQTGPLVLDARRIPRGKAFARTIAGELVVSAAVAERFGQAAIEGVDLRPVQTIGKRNHEKEWYQFVPQFNGAVIVPPTRVGNELFDDDPRNQGRCPTGHLLGLNLVSEVSVTSASVPRTDIVGSQQFIGVRRGLLRPERVVLISPRVWRLLKSEKFGGGYAIEVAHLV